MPRPNPEDPPDSGGAAAFGTSHVPRDARGVLLPERQDEEEEDEDEDIYLHLLQTLQESRSEEVPNMDGVCNHTWDDAEAQEELVLTVVEHTILDDIRDIGDTHTQSNFEIALEGSMARSHDKGADILLGE